MEAWDVAWTLQYVCWMLVSLTFLLRAPVHHRGKAETTYPQTPFSRFASERHWLKIWKESRTYDLWVAVVADVCTEVKFTEASSHILEDHLPQRFSPGTSVLASVTFRGGLSVLHVPALPTVVHSPPPSSNTWNAQSSFRFTGRTLFNTLCFAEKQNTS